MSNSKEWLSFDRDWAKKSLASTKSNGFRRLFQRTLSLDSKLYPEDSTELEKVDVDSDLFTSFRGLLILGRFLGVIPISGIFKRSHKDWTCSLRSISGVISLSCAILLAFNAGLGISDGLFAKKRNAKDVYYFAGHPLYASWGLFTYGYFLLRRQRFVKMFQAWSNCHSSLRYTQPDKMLKWTIILVTVVMLASTVLENAVLHMEYFVVFDHINGHNSKHGEEKNNAPMIQIYYWRSHPYWNKVFGYNPILPVLAFIAHKLILYGGNYVDVLMALIARALYFRFQALNKVGKEMLLKSGKLEKSTELDHEAWSQFAKDHESLCNVLNKMNKFFSPVVFVSYTIDIYFFCMQLHHTLNPDYLRDSIVHSIYSPWSFLHIIMRLFLVSYCFAKVNDEAHETREIVRRCPEELYSFQIAKLDKRLNTGPQLGFTGLNCFTVTKPFMLSILQVVFTIEIVLLQGLTTELNKT